MMSEQNKASKWVSAKKSAKTFAYGFVSGLVFLRLVRFYQVRRLPSIDRLVSASLSTLRGNEDVRRVIGTSVRPGLLSHHDYTGGIKWKIPSINGGKDAGVLMSLLPFSYKGWSMRLLYQVIGDNQAGFVTVETLPGGKTDLGSDIGLKTLLIDFHDGQRLVIRGK